MSDSDITEQEYGIETVGFMHQAWCSPCGWKGRHFEGEKAAERELDAHREAEH